MVDSELDIDIPVADRTIPRLLRRQVEARPDDVFLLDVDGQRTYRQVDQWTDQIVSRLAGLGVTRHQRVLVMMDNGLDVVAVLLALVKMGAVAVPVNTMAKGRLLRYLVADSAATLCIVEAAHEEALAEAVRAPLQEEFPCLLTTAVVRGEGAPLSAAGLAVERLAGYDETAVTAPQLPDVDYHDTALIIYTSGTTGRSKGAIVTHAHAVSLGMVLPRQLRLTSQDRLYAYLPFFHLMSISSSMLSTLVVGGSLAVSRRFSASNFWKEAAQLEVTQFNGLGSVLEILAAQPPSPHDRAHGVRVIYAGPLPRDPAGFERRFGAQIATGYGMTELPPMANGTPRASYRDRKLLGPVQNDFTDVQVVDELDVPVPMGEIGEIVARPRHPWTGAMGYLNKPDETAEATRNLWFHTGDLGRLDAEGNLYFEARKKEAIRRRGEFISPLELEEALLECPFVQEAAALPYASELSEDDVLVAVVLAPGCAKAEGDVHAFASERLPRFMVPRYIALVESLPMTPTGKVERARVLQTLTGRSDIWDAEEHGG